MFNVRKFLNLNQYRKGMHEMATYQTIQKKELLQFLEKHSERAYTIDEMVSAMETDPACSSRPGNSTIYRLLPSLVEAGTVHRFSRGSGRKASYQIVGGQSCHSHIHMKCTGCGRLLHMSDEASRAISCNLLDTSGFRLDMGRTTLFGLCRSCTENTENGRKGNLTI